MKLKGMVFCAFTFPGILFCTQAFAVDNLYLCGVVTEINAKDGLATINVTSANCRGLKKFRLPKVMGKGKASLKVDERKCFFIDSDHCKTGYVHAITRIVPE